MKASVLDLRRRTKEIVRALDRNETVTILHRGKEKGVIVPTGARRGGDQKASGHSAFGMWKDRADLKNVERAVRRLRKGRPHAL